MPRLAPALLALAAALLVLLYAAPARAAWNFDLAQNLAQVNAISYCPRDDITKWTCGECDPNLTIRGVHTDPKSGCLVIVADNGADMTLVVFKGTDPLSIKEWLVDLNAAKAPASTPMCEGCAVHTGFSDTEEALRAPVEEAMLASLDRLGPDARLVVAGHSLGAALATLFTYNMRAKHSMPLELYTFGNPRVGNRQFADAFDALVTYQDGSSEPSAFRVSHRYDVVPHVPLEVMGYHHHGVLYFCKDADGVDCRPMPGAENDGASPGILSPLGVADHGQYMGISFLKYVDTSSQSGCH